MLPRVTKVKPEADYMLRLTFKNGEVRRFDVKPLLHRGVFQRCIAHKVFLNSGHEDSKTLRAYP